MFEVQKILKLYGSDFSGSAIRRAEEKNLIPESIRIPHGSKTRRVWGYSELPQIGERYGFLKKKDKSTIMTVFTTKGGVLKTSLSINIARITALHNIKTLVIGLDLQGDITNILKSDDLESSETIDEALSSIKKKQGLERFFNRKVSLSSIIEKTEIPTLDFIPETASLVSVDRIIQTRNRREFVLSDEIIEPLKSKYDLILMDCSPNWNFLVTNAVAACDVLVSPLECKITNLNNFNVFNKIISEFKKELKLNYKQIHVPTRLSTSRKLSSEIRSWYTLNIKNCTNSIIRESAIGEESIAARRSVIEHAPTNQAATEMRDLVKEIWNQI